MSNQNRLRFFPVTFFASVMGLIGFTIAMGKVFEVFGVNGDGVFNIFFGISACLFVFLSLIYLIKFLKYPTEVKKDFKHPVKLNFIPTFSISLILFSIVFMEINKSLSYALWLSGSILHLFLLLLIMNRWFFHDFKINFKNPAWFIPVVGPVLSPVSGANFSPEISWFFFSIGIILWLPILTILLYRIIFNDPLPEKLLPTLFIMIAPPAVGFISYVKLTNGIDSFAKILFNFGIFTFLFLITFIRKFSKIKFYLSWWAYTFPMAAFTISLVLYYNITHIIFYKNAVLVLFILTTIIVFTVVFKTIIAATKGEICVEE